MNCLRFYNGPYYLLEEEKLKLKKIILSFYFIEEERYTKQNDFCDYQLFKIWTFTKYVKGFLIYDVFEYLADFLVSICFPKDIFKCFDHARLYDCHNYHSTRLVKFKPFSKIRSLLNIPQFLPLRVLNVFKMKTKYGEKNYILACDQVFKFKCWLPKSGLKEIRNELETDNPSTFDFLTNKVYIRVIEIKEYNNSKYAVIQCRLSD